MKWEGRYLDWILVPSGLLILFTYHLFLLYRILEFPHTTSIGYENHNKRAWVERVMQIDVKGRGIVLQVISSNVGVSTSLATLCIALSSLTGAIAGSSSSNIFSSGVLYGDSSSTIITVKYVGLLTCFLTAFACFIHSARHFVHVSFLITTPRTEVPVKYIQQDIIKAEKFWSLGLRALYLSVSLLMWIFGPIPMFVSAVIMVVALYFLDGNSCPMHEYQSSEQTTATKNGRQNGTNQVPEVLKQESMNSHPIMFSAQT